MTDSHRSGILTTSILVVLALPLASCISSKSPQAFKLSFLPATPAPEPAMEEPPRIESGLYSNETPEIVQRVLAPPKNTEADSRIFKAEIHFDTGRKLYQQGDLAGARREFDAAIDVLLSAPENIPDRQRLEHRLDQMAETIYRYDLEGLGSGATQSEVVYDKTPLDEILTLTFPTDPNLRPKVKEEIAATVSQLPLEENDAVLSYIHYFSTDRGHKTLVAGLRRSGRYRPLIQRILDDEGVPQELIFLAQAESGFLPRAKSYKAAVGMWQFVQFRGRQYGLNQTATSDDRMDPEKATRAAAHHLHDLYAEFGDWYLAMAAYNCGPYCVEHAVQRTGYADFWELSRLNVLPKQTANYVPLIIAMTIMAKNPKDYDLEGIDFDEPVHYDTVEIDAPTHLALVADASERPVSEIQDLNPAVLKLVAPSGYQLRVPQGTSDAVRIALNQVPAAHRASWRIHRVIDGETLDAIAHRYSTSATSISAVNQKVRVPETGDLLVIPAGYPQRATVRTTAVSARHKVTRRSTTARKPTAVTYKTAALASKHRPSVN
ncbi:MAG TPA: transglycosylase SLT domain-containing protein [Bryobacteraceae bacterium]|nr:transglycosylase SLT domain-containing protein [Bryobacteraceae bacterium]